MIDEEIEELCKTLRRPGGTNPDGTANLGFTVAARAQTHLKMVAWTLRYKEHTSRAVTPAQINAKMIREHKPKRHEQLQHKNPEKADYPKIGKDWPKNFDAIDELLKNVYDSKGVPLGYLTRMDIEVTPNAEDPEENYLTVQEEMIARCPDDTNSVRYKTANAQLWDVLAYMCRDHEAWIHIKPAQWTKDGRQAYEYLFDNYLGPNNVDHQAKRAEVTLATLRYNGETKQFPFDSYIRAHKAKHQIMEGLKHYGYSGMDPRSMVRHFITGIKDPTLQFLKPQITASAELRNSFAKTVQLFQDFIQNDKEDEVKTYNISTVWTGKPEDVPDRYYTPEEYKALGKEAKWCLRAKRMKRQLENKTGKEGEGPPKKSQKKFHKKTTAKIKKLTATIAKLEAKLDGKKEVNDGNDANSEAATTTNRNNKALTRQAKQA